MYSTIQKSTAQKSTIYRSNSPNTFSSNGLIESDQLRKRAMILLTLITALCTITAEWVDFERARQLKNKKSADVALEKIFDEINSEAAVEEKYRVTDLEIKAALSRLLLKPSVRLASLSS